MRIVATAALLLISLAGVAQQSGTSRPVTLSFTSPAISGMPIWLMVNTPQPQYLHYPGSEVATDFGCVDIEVQHHGTTIEPFKMPGPFVGGGIVCGTISGDSPPARFPLHLQFPKLLPGTYQVRYRRYYPDFRTHQKNTMEESLWTELKVDHATPAQIESWLTNRLAHPPESPGLLLGEYLPSLLVSRDARALDAVLGQAFNKNAGVAYYAANSLSLFDAAEVRPRLLSAISERGLSYNLADRFSSLAELIKPVANEIATLTACFIASNDPEKVAGAMHAARMISFFKLDDERRRALSRAEQNSVERVLEQRNERAAGDLVQFLAQLKTPEAHDQIWRFINAHLAEEQALLCVTWMKDPADLPKLATILSTYDATDPNGSRRSGVFYGMKAYGAAAQPYFRQVLTDSRQAFVRTSAAQELALMNDPEGWKFFRTMIDERPFYYDEMVRWLRESFTEFRGTDEQGLKELLDRKIQTR